MYIYIIDIDDIDIHIYTILYIYKLVGGWPTPLKKYDESSVGMIIPFPTLMESHKIHVPNHQRDILIIDYHD